MSSPAQTTSYRELVLERFLFTRKTMLARETLHNVNLDVYADDVMHRLVISLRAEILAHPLKEETHTIVEQPVYDSWRERFVDELPHGFRRRFCAHLWGLHPEAPLGKRRTHRIKFDVRGLFPDSTVRYPDSLGPVVMYQQADLQSAIEDYCGAALR